MDSTNDKLERLAALHRMGALTDAEYAAQKALLLDTTYEQAAPLPARPISREEPPVPAALVPGSVGEFIASDALAVLLGQTADKLRPRFVKVAQKAAVTTLSLNDGQVQRRLYRARSWNWMGFFFTFFWGAYWAVPGTWPGVAVWCALALADPFVPGLEKIVGYAGGGLAVAFGMYGNGLLLASLIKDRTRRASIVHRGSWKRVIIAIVCVLGAAAVSYVLETSSLLTGTSPEGSASGAASSTALKAEIEAAASSTAPVSAAAAEAQSVVAQSAAPSFSNCDDMACYWNRDTEHLVVPLPGGSTHTIKRQFGKTQPADKDPAHVIWGATSTISVTCSLSQPSVSLDGQTDDLGLNAAGSIVPSVLNGTYATYAAVCHPEAKDLDPDALAKRFGYRAKVDE